MTLRFCSLASGSSGNCVYIESDNTKILIDAGFSGKKVENLMRAAGLSPRELDAILVTHEHIDHAKGVGVLSRRFQLPVIANAETWAAMEPVIGAISERNSVVCSSDSFFRIKDLDIYAMKTYHDSAGSLGFVLSDGKSKASVLTDTGCVTNKMKTMLMDSDLIYMEANHDPDMLYNGPYPPSLKTRIAGNRGHLSNEDCARALGEVLQGRGEQVLLAHLSEENNTPKLCYDTVWSFLRSLGLDADRDIHLDLAPRHRPGPLYQVGTWKL